MIKVLQEGLGGIRDILIDGTQPSYTDDYRKADLSLRNAQGTNQIITLTPRFGIEAIAIVVMAALAYSMTKTTEGIITVIPILGSIALGAQRMLPSMQLVYASLSTIQGAKASLEDTLLLLDQPIPSSMKYDYLQPLPFEDNISLENVSFGYNTKSNLILNNVNLKIPKGSRIGFVGPTGCGKSTLLDIIMALLEPTDGCVLVDGVQINERNIRSWQKQIAHVPQNIYLSDKTIAENIAFGVPKNQIDFQRVAECASKAQISKTIESWPNSYNTTVGERGVRISGGQRQRIGIAGLFTRKQV